MKRLLIIEDDVAEAIYAQAEAAKAGFRDFTVATTLEDALAALPDADMVVTDLFFPGGNVAIEDYIERFLPHYEAYRQKRFPPEDHTILYCAIATSASLFEMTPEEYVEEVMAQMYTPKSVLDAARDAVKGVKDSERYEQFLKIEDAVRTGTSLPLGIIVAEKAKELALPVAIVTSTHHHDDAFEAVRELITAPYTDRVVDGRKDWEQGIAYLLR